MKVLLVDDYERTASALSQILKYKGLDVEYSLNAKDAIKKIDSSEYDYIVLDVIINGDDNNGLVIYDYIVSADKKSNVIFITGCEKESKYSKEAEKRAPVVYKDFDPIQFADDIISGIYDSENRPAEEISSE